MDNGGSISTQINRSTPPSTLIGTNKEQAMAKKIATSNNRSYQETSTGVNTGSSLLMGKIVGSNKDVTEETLFVGSEIPKYGVLTNHEMELERVNIFSSINFFCNNI